MFKKVKVMSGIKSILYHPWLRLLSCVGIGLILLTVDSSGGYTDETTWIGYLGITIFLTGLLSIPIQWIIDYFINS